MNLKLIFDPDKCVCVCVCRGRVLSSVCNFQLRKHCLDFDEIWYRLSNLLYSNLLQQKGLLKASKRCADRRDQLVFLEQFILCLGIQKTLNY